MPKILSAKLLKAFLLVPVGFFFLACCCLTVTQPQKVVKVGCKSCPQPEKSQSHDNCPHAKIKAVFEHAKSIKVFVSLFELAPLVSVREFYPWVETQTFAYPFELGPPVQVSLYSQNLILRV